MNQEDSQILQSAQNGKESAREVVLRKYRDFAYKTACRCAKKKLTWGEDEELSIALMALNEALDRYDETRGASFKTFASRTIKSRLTDYWRKQKKHSETVSLDETENIHHAESLEAQKRYSKKQTDISRKNELVKFRKDLNNFGINLETLEDASPKHRRTREKLKSTARSLAKRRKLVSKLRRTKQLPQSALAEMAGVSKKFLERGRKYIIALVLIMTDERYEHLRTFLQLPYISQEDSSCE